MAGIYIKLQEKMYLKKKGTQLDKYQVQWNMVNVNEKWVAAGKVNMFNKTWRSAKEVIQEEKKGNTQPFYESS